MFTRRRVLQEYYSVVWLVLRHDNRLLYAEVSLTLMVSNKLRNKADTNTSFLVVIANGLVEIK